jgi:hypothetical protein
MQLVADDPINRSIWSESVALQRKIVERSTLPLQVGAQQAMPKPVHAESFSAQDPLPWVPDLVGSRFGTSAFSVLVVGSSYNGFIEGYTDRNAVMPLRDYVEAKRAGMYGLQRFVTDFKACVVDPDEKYYMPILRDLLAGAGCDLDACCLTDLCKASFVLRGTGTGTENRGDKGSDPVVEDYWDKWVPYVTSMFGAEGDTPLSYQWLWQRMQRCHVIIALGTIAEYGVMKVLLRMAKAPKAWSWKKSGVVPDHPTMTAGVSDWEYGYACSERKMRDWLSSEDWWVLSNSGGQPRWLLLPIYHPAYAIVGGHDCRYLNAVPRVRRMIQDSAETFTAPGG